MELNDNNNKFYVSKLSNPISTSGDGHRFEIRVQTLFAILMLSHGRVPGFPNSEIVEIDQQTRVKEWNIDDFMLVLQDLNSTKQRRIFFQVKRSFGIGENEAFREIIRAAYYDFCDERFDRKHDILVLFCGNISCDDLDLLSSVHDLSEAQISAESFFTKIRVQGFKSEQFRTIVQTIEKEIKDCNKKATDDEVFSFLKCFRIWSVDLHHNDGFVLALMHSFVSFVTSASPHVVWSTVCEYMDTRNKDSGELRRESFSEDIRLFFANTNRQEMPNAYLASNMELPSSRYSYLVNRIQTHKLFKDIFFAFLIGGWNEKNPKDKAFIETLTKHDYDSWKQIMISLYNEFQEIITFKSHEWKVLHRKEIVPLLKWEFYSEELDSYEEESIKLLSGTTMEHELSSASDPTVLQDEDCSIQLRDSVSATLSIMGNIPDTSNGFSHRLQSIAYSVVKQVLKDASIDVWERLSRNIDDLAEAAPTVFFDAVETLMCNNVIVQQQAYNTENTEDFMVWWNYVSNIISALEKLVWCDSYFTRATDILFRLANSAFLSKTNKDSATLALTTILLPWHPQTFASAEQRISIVDHFVNEAPDSSWDLLLALLPRTYSTTINTQKPKYLNNISNESSVSVTRKEYWEVSEHYLSLAMTLANGNLSRIMSLIDLINAMPPHYQKDVVELLCSDSILELSDEDRFPLWSKLKRFCAKHRTYPNANWALSEESLKPIESVVERLKPKKMELEYRPLFSHNCKDFFPHESGNWDLYQKTEALILELQDTAVKTILSEKGVTGILEFAKTIENAHHLGLIVADVCSDQESQLILDTCLVSDNAQLKTFVSAFIPQRYKKNSQHWLDNILRTNWNPEQTAFFLCALYPVSSFVLELKRNWLKEYEMLYWEFFSLPKTNLIDKDCFYTVIDNLLLVGRPEKAINLLGQLSYNSYLSFDATKAIKALALFSEKGCKADINSESGYNYLNVLQLIQKSDVLSDDRKASIEWENIEYLSHSYGDGLPSPQYIYKKMSLDPDYFCKLLCLVYKSNNDSDDQEDDTSFDERDFKKKQDLLGLLWNWSFMPEAYNKDNCFCFPLFEKWFNSVVEKASKLGRREIALVTIGEALAYAPAEFDDSLWINKGIAKLLDRIDYKELREGYRCGCTNLEDRRRDPTAPSKVNLSDEYRKKASAVDKEGLPRLAALLDSIANAYETEARRINEY